MPTDIDVAATRLFREAQEAAKLGRVDLAWAPMRRLLVINPDVSALWLDFARTFTSANAKTSSGSALLRAAFSADKTGYIQKSAGAQLARQGDFTNAARCLRSAFRSRPGDYEVGRMLAAAQSKAGDGSAAFHTLQAMVERARVSNDESGLAALADFIFRNNDLKALRRLVPEYASLPIKPVDAGLVILSLLRSNENVLGDLELLTKRDDLFESKSIFYSLEEIFAHLWSERRSDAINLLSRLAGHSRCIEVSDVSDVPIELLLDAASKHPTSTYSRAVFARFRDGDMAEAVRCLAQVIMGEEAPPAVFEGIVPEGPFTGHSLWHLCNPFFAAWHQASSESQDVQENWANNPAISKARDDDVVVAYREWSRSPAPITKRLQAFTQKLGPKARYFDVGCGTGHWLRYLVESADVDVAGVHGTDLHANRTDAAVRLLKDWADTNGARARAAGLEERVFACDVFKNGDIPRQRVAGEIDAVTLFFVTGCFEDDALPSFLKNALSVRPRYVFHATVGDRWTLYRGRADDEKYFAPLGYELVEREWSPEPIPRQMATNLLLPLKYWSSFRTDIFRRTDG